MPVWHFFISSVYYEYMKILTWNIYNLFDETREVTSPLGVKHFLLPAFVEERKKYFVEKIKEFSPDIIFFQEVGSQKLLEEIVKESLGEKAMLFFASPDKRGIGNVCVSMVPATFEEISLSPFTLPEFTAGEGEREITSKRERGYIKCTAKKDNGDSINLLGIHLKSRWKHPKEDSEGREILDKNLFDTADSSIRSVLIQLAEVRTLLHFLVKEDMSKPYIVLGDFNDDHKGLPLNLFEKVGLKNALLELPEEERFSHYYKEYKVLLDNVLVTSPVWGDIKNVKIFHDAFAAGEDIEALELPISDHAPVLLEIA
jgi:endonuclease/exonuclease/phosphatase family metal-dependent hydrolase